MCFPIFTNNVWSYSEYLLRSPAIVCSPICTPITSAYCSPSLRAPTLVGESNSQETEREPKTRPLTHRHSIKALRQTNTHASQPRTRGQGVSTKQTHTQTAPWLVLRMHRKPLTSKVLPSVTTRERSKACGHFNACTAQRNTAGQPGDTPNAAQTR